MNTPAPSSRSGVTRPTSRLEICPTAIMPRALPAKIMLNICDDSPYLVCSTNGDPAM